LGRREAKDLPQVGNTGCAATTAASSNFCSRPGRADRIVTTQRIGPARPPPELLPKQPGLGKEIMMARARRGVVLMLSCLMLGACAGQPVRPATQIISRPLDARVDVETVLALVAFAAKDRICTAREQQDRQSEPRVAGRSKWQPISAASHEPYPTYVRCMDSERVTACDAVEEDLRTVHTLFDRDPRLAAIITFDQFLLRLQQQCPAHQPSAVTARSLRPLRQQALQRCQGQYQPLLKTTAILLRTMPPPDEEARYLWFARCRGTAGFYFMDVHCFGLGRPGPSQPELRVEPYFCPLFKNHFS
jgi:hypothetical protein